MKRYVDINGVDCVVLPYTSVEQGSENFQKIAATPLSQRDIPTIKAWRAAQHAAGLPSGLNDFYVLNGLCVECRGSGWRLKDGYCRSEGFHYSACQSCGGTGKSTHTETQRGCNEC